MTVTELCFSRASVLHLIKTTEMCSPARHNKLFDIQENDTAAPALLCLAAGNQNTSPGEHQRSQACTSPGLCSVTLFPWCYHSILIITLQEEHKYLVYQNALDFYKQPDSAALRVQFHDQLKQNSSLKRHFCYSQPPLCEKSGLHGWKLMFGETFYKDQLSTTLPLLCQHSRDCREQKTELPSLVSNQLLMNLSWFQTS